MPFLVCLRGGRVHTYIHTLKNRAVLGLSVALHKPPTP